MATKKTTEKKEVTKANKKPKHKVTIEVKHDILPTLEEIKAMSLAIVAKFTIVEIKMKSDWRWKVKMLVHETLPKSYHDYAIKLEFDDAPYLKSIAQYEKEIKECESTPTLLPDIDRKSIMKLDEKIAETKKEMAKMKAECTDIEFVTQTEEIKYKDGDTALLFKVLDTVVEPLNEKKYRLGDYRAVLDPIIK
jgi:hypothetical protein